MRNETWAWLAFGAFAVLAFTGGAVLMKRLNIAQIAAVAENAGFSGDDLTTAVAIALAESGGNPGSLGDVTLGNSYGLWQINARWHPEFGPDFNHLYDPQENAHAAYSVYQAAGFSFRPWSTFKNGAYLAHVERVASTLSA